VPVRRREEDLKADGNGLSSLIALGLETRLLNDESIDLTWDTVQLQAGNRLITRHPDDLKATRLQ
jgi:hypothetical protein